MSNTHSNTAEQPKKKNNRFAIVFGALVLAGSAFGITKYVHSLSHEETDDAQIDGYVSPVIPRVAGYVESIRVKDNQVVKKGDTLLILDERDLKIKLAQAEAALAAAQSSFGMAEATTTASQANVSTSQANVSAINAQIETAKVNVWRATQDFNRYANLIKDHSITQQQYEQAEAQKQTAERQLQVLIEQKNAAMRQTTAAASQSQATAKQEGEAEVETAKLNLSYAVITAPEDGMVSKINIQPGQFVNAGQSLFSIVRNDIWVTANFKETQLEKMKEGQKVMVKVDAYPDQEFEAKLTSFAPATGAKFALLPADNASGNFVKVVQRLPVKMEFVNKNDELVKRLRPGMNVIVDVHIN
jgi:membrane fusion protein (multidrug efflux system)